jgi:pimeloyl-ACP methyl ester carboxylesterase
LRVPQIFAMVRVILARQLIRTFGSAPVFRGAQPGSRWFIQMMGVGHGADPAIADFVHDLFATTPRLGRGAWARVLVESIGPRHIDITGLAVPAVVIGSTKDRLLPMSQARKIAAALPNLVDLVEVPGGHCAILEHPDLVNEQLRLLAEGSLVEQRIS